MTGDLDDRIAALLPAMRDWRHALHAHPETAFEEHRTAATVATLLESFGLEVHRGLAGTGVVAVLRAGDGPAVALRADMDALPLAERTGLPYASTQPGRMHACGHDGHMAMLLGAANLLAASRHRRGTVVFIFQPAEEGEGGGRAMVEAGLFERFPVDSVWGLHNWPGLPVGRIATRAGPLMAAYDVFEAVLEGRGCHAAMPHLGTDPVVAAAQLITAWQTIVSRGLHPLDGGVVSVTQIHAGESWNIIPDRLTLRGTVRSFKPKVQERIERRMAEIAAGIAAAAGITCALEARRRYPATVNSPAETTLALAAAAATVGADNVDADPMPSMGGEDFAFMLQRRPGCYVWLGAGSGEHGLHNPFYDFNDAALPVGARYWVRLVETLLPAL